MVCMRNGVKDRSMVANGKTNGWWELQNSIKHDELRNGMFGAHEEGGPLRAHAPLFKDYLPL
jgi:hypothetical protein